MSPRLAILCLILFQSPLLAQPPTSGVYETYPFPVPRAPVKTEERKAYENAFFDQTEALLVLLSDPRAGGTPPVKLGFADIDALVNAVPEEQTILAIRISLRLLSIDAALKRFDPLWWDGAEYHPEEGE